MSSAMQRQQRTKGENFMDEAEKCLAKRSWFSSSDSKYEDAAELLDKAGNAFKSGGCYAEAGAAYRKAAALYRDKLKQSAEAAKAMSNAGNCLRKSDPAEAIAAYQSAVSLLCDAQRLTQAAKLCKEIAEIFENEDPVALEGKEKGEEDEVSGDNVVMALKSYEQAADLFEAEGSKSQASNCRAKVAELSSAALDPPDLLRAAQIYDEIGRACTETTLLKFNAKAYFLQAVMCHLANGDAIAASQALNRYEALDYTFGDSREGKFARQLLEAMENFDAEAFATACYDYDRITKLDPWKTTILVKVKRSIEEQGGVAGEEDDVDLT